MEDLTAERAQPRSVGRAPSDCTRQTAPLGSTGRRHKTAHGQGIATNHLYYGDNLAVLCDSIPTESVDLIYLDPPFNSNASYNQLFKTPDGTSSAVQFE